MLALSRDQVMAFCYTAVMAERKPMRHIDRLRAWRNRPDRHEPIGQIVEGFFQKQIARPHKQVAQFAKLWEELVPPAIAAETRLASFTRGVLHVEVSSAAVHYELDRLLRANVQRELKQRSTTTLRQVRIRVAHWER